MNLSAPVSEPVVFTPELLWERALEQLDGIYDELAQRKTLADDGCNADNMFASPVCVQWSMAASRLVRAEVGLFDQAATVEIREWTWTPPIPMKPDLVTITPHHRFVSVCLTGLEPRLIDGTWQQFLPPDKRHTDLPKLLSGSHEQIAENIRTAGIEEPYIRLWCEAKRSRFQA